MVASAWSAGCSRLRVGFANLRPGLKPKPRPGPYQVCWLLGLSPILATLTRTFSDDTICALTSGLFLCHLVSHDYAYASHYSSRLQGSLSLNAAIFACVLLAARLPSTTHVFALTSLGVLCFMLLPALSRTLHALPATQACHQYSSQVTYDLSGSPTCLHTSPHLGSTNTPRCGPLRRSSRSPPRCSFVSQSFSGCTSRAKTRRPGSGRASHPRLKAPSRWRTAALRAPG